MPLNELIQLWAESHGLVAINAAHVTASASKPRCHFVIYQSNVTSVMYAFDAAAVCDLADINRFDSISCAMHFQRDLFIDRVTRWGRQRGISVCNN